MGLSTFLSRKKDAQSVVLIDVGANSVAGGYARYIENETPVLLYSKRFPVEIRKGEPHEHSILRSLSMLGDALIREGAPILMRATGSGSTGAILVSTDTPWQEITLRTEHLERKTPFLFTKSIVDSVLENTATTTPEKALVNESITSTILNGYETRSPYGRKVHRASLIVFSSFVEKSISESITSFVRGLFHHTEPISHIDGRSLRYQATRTAFPHERDAFILDATGPMTSVALVRKNLFTALAHVSDSATDVDSWTRTVTDEFAKLAEKHSLPRVIFLLAREPEISSLHQALASADFQKLWLSDNPPKIVPIFPGHITGLVRQATAAPPDLQLLLMALYHQQNIPKRDLTK